MVSLRLPPPELSGPIMRTILQFSLQWSRFAVVLLPHILQTGSFQRPLIKGRIGFRDQVLSSAASSHPFLAPGCVIQASAINGKGQR